MPRKGRKIERFAIYFFGLLLGLGLLFPIIWMLIVSLESQLNIFSQPSLEMFTKLTLSNYYFVFDPSLGIAKDMVNSFVIDGLTTVVALIIGSMAAYSLNRIQVKGSQGITFWIISQRMMPAIAVVIPFYLFYQAAGLYDTYWGMVLAYLTFSVPFVVFTMGGYINEIPREIDESAMVDGLGRMGVFLRMILPLSTSGLVATALMTFVFSWNDLIMALVLTGANTRTVAVGAALFLPSSGRGALWGPASAIGMLLMIPTVIFAFLLRRSMVRGLTLGAVKA
jgi:multiple sugar transport system permease protein